MNISIIIPTYNESETIVQLIAYLFKYKEDAGMQIIVADGGSTDDTLLKAEKAGAIALSCPGKGRAVQMNFGAAHATGDIFYFVHADTFPPPSYINDIQAAINNKFSCGRYITRFNSKKFSLKLNAWFTRFDMFMCYGGDQTLFITKDLFNLIGGYNADMQIMEDYEIIVRARKKAEYCIIKKHVLISARKYETNGWLKVQKANYTIIQMYKRGATQNQMADTYKKMLQYRY